MAHKKSGGTAQNVHDSPGQRLGIKRFAGQKVIAGNILVRQKGTKWYPGKGTSMGKDFTIFATEVGEVYFTEKKQLKFNGRVYKDIFIHVKPLVNSTAKAPAKKSPVAKTATAVAAKPKAETAPAAKKPVAKKPSAEKKAPAAKKPALKKAA